ncbi:MAG TPA: nicotinamide-nucleotide amidohydrolase family protein [Acholeplasmataceae bacterium]|nr:nicotinamide-nucleotide amidohydrolase family protein [Acholeplasmataceae bacterium]
MSVYILNIGDELLSGNIINTNASFLAHSLDSLGIEIKKIISVRDAIKDIVDVVNEFLNSTSSILITTGGLGPTHDDCTKQAICEALGLKMRFNENASQDMYLYFEGEKNDCNRNQAYFPEGAKIIANKYCSADGAIINYQDKIIIMLVGPHHELKSMFNSVIPYLKEFKRDTIVIDKMLYGNRESYFENIIYPLLKDYPHLNVSPYAKDGVIRFRIKTTPEHQEELNLFLDIFDNLVGDYLFSNQEESLNYVLARGLQKHKLKISFAESVTGGLLAKLITDVPGASNIISESFVTYSEDSKVNLLSVNPKTIKQYGVVSTNVTSEMVIGLDKISKADINVAISGYAGPTGDVGHICYSIKYQDKIFSGEKKFKGTREMIRNRAANEVIYQVIQIIKREI